MNKLILGVFVAVALLAGVSALPSSAIAANAVEYGLITSQITASDLGVDSVGTLPTSPFYFLKQWGRGIERLFTFDPTAKAQLELNIENQTAAEVWEVVNTNPSDAVALQTALKNYTDEQQRLNTQLAGLNDTSTNPQINGNLQIADLLKKVDEKTALHVALLGQIGAGAASSTAGIRSEGITELVGDLKKANDNLQTTFAATIDWGDGTSASTASVKQKAADQISRAEVAISEASSLKITVPKQTQGSTFGEKMNAGNSGNTGGTSSTEPNDGSLWLYGAIAKAKDNLASAKMAFAAGKYGEAYGQARSAEATVPILATGSNFPDKKVDKTAPTASSTTPPVVTPKQSPKINENESPIPSNKAEAASTTKSTLEKTVIPEAGDWGGTRTSDKAASSTATSTPGKKETAQQAGTSAGPASNYDRAN